MLLFSQLLTQLPLCLQTLVAALSSVEQSIFSPPEFGALSYGAQAIIAPGATSHHTFTEAGEYPCYFCLLHPNQVGMVIVP